MKIPILHSLDGVDLEDYAQLTRREIERSSDTEGFQGFKDPVLVRHFARARQKSEKKLKLIEQAIRSGIPSPETMQRVWLWAALGSVLLGLLLLIIPLDVLTARRLALHVIFGIIIVIGSIWTPYRTTSPLAAVMVGVGLWFVPIMWAFTEAFSKGLLALGFATVISGKLAALVWTVDRDRTISKQDYEFLKKSEGEVRLVEDELDRIKLLPEEEQEVPLAALRMGINERYEETLRQGENATTRVWNSLRTANTRWFFTLATIGLVLVYASEQVKGRS